MNNFIGPLKPLILSITENRISSGSYGDYINLNDGTGVKILRNCCSRDIDVNMDHARREFRIQKRARKVLGDLVPDVYGCVVTSIEVEGVDGPMTEYYPGIIMEHIEGQTLLDYVNQAVISQNLDYDSKCEIEATYLKTVEWEMRSKGIDKNDHHSENMIVSSSGRITVIDWGMGYNPYAYGIYVGKMTLEEQAKYA